jgi:hypothetical protein
VKRSLRKCPQDLIENNHFFGKKKSAKFPSFIKEEDAVKDPDELALEAAAIPAPTGPDVRV